MPLVYPRLRAIAGSLLGHETEGHTLQATALVHEVYLRLLGQRKIGWEDRAHFFSFAAQAMRMILAGHARSSHAQKRGGEAVHVPLHQDVPWINLNSPEMIDVNRALDELETVDSRKARLVELRYFLGCTAEEAADVLQVSKATVDRDLHVARAWLFRRLHGQPIGPETAMGLPS